MKLKSSQVHATVCITILQALAIVMTLVRLSHRWNMKRMWWDDWSAIIPLILHFLFIPIMWLTNESKFPHSNSHITSKNSNDS